jgi:hypothetical protein
MLSRRTLLLAAIAATSFSIPAMSTAHDAARVESNVSIDGGELEVIHILQLSAAQRLLYKGGIIDKNDMTGLRSRAQALIYAAERFELKADEETIALDPVGAEIAGGHLYIYQTGTLETLPESWSARNSILRDLSPRFDNMVNVPSKDGIETLVFTGSEIEAFQTTQ